MTMTPTPVQDLTSRLLALGPTFRANSVWSEGNCRMHPDVFATLSEGGFFSLWKPRALGGLELTPIEGLQIFEEACRLEPAVGWAIANQTGIDAMPFASSCPNPALRKSFPDTARPIRDGMVPTPAAPMWWMADIDSRPRPRSRAPVTMRSTS